MARKPAGDGGNTSCPFEQIISILLRLHAHHFEAVTETCPEYDARRVKRLGRPPHFYILEDEDGAQEGATRFRRYSRQHPAPDESEAFERAVRLGRELASAADIPFSDVTEAVLEAKKRFKRARAASVLPPSARPGYEKHYALSDPKPLLEFLAEERDACEPLFEQMRTFADFARGAGVLVAPQATSPANNHDGERGGASKAHDLTATEAAVLKVIETQPKGLGISGKEILAKLAAERIDIKETTLRRHILPKLKAKHNVTNHPAAGGYLIP